MRRERVHVEYKEIHSRIQKTIINIIFVCTFRWWFLFSRNHFYYHYMLLLALTFLIFVKFSIDDNAIFQRQVKNISNGGKTCTDSWSFLFILSNVAWNGFLYLFVYFSKIKFTFTGERTLTHMTLEPTILIVTKITNMEYITIELLCTWFSNSQILSGRDFRLLNISYF